MIKSKYANMPTSKIEQTMQYNRKKNHAKNGPTSRPVQNVNTTATKFDACGISVTVTVLCILLSAQIFLHKQWINCDAVTLKVSSFCC